MFNDVFHENLQTLIICGIWFSLPTIERNIYDYAYKLGFIFTFADITDNNKYFTDQEIKQLETENVSQRIAEIDEVFAQGSYAPERLARAIANMHFSRALSNDLRIAASSYHVVLTQWLIDLMNSGKLYSNTDWNTTTACMGINKTNVSNVILTEKLQEKYYFKHSWSESPNPLKSFNEIMLSKNRLCLTMLNWQNSVEQLRIEFIPTILTKIMDERLKSVAFDPLGFLGDFDSTTVSVAKEKFGEYLKAFKITLMNMFKKFDKVKNVSIIVKLNTKYSNVEIVYSWNKGKLQDCSNKDEEEENDTYGESVVLQRQDFIDTVNEYIEVYMDQLCSTKTLENSEMLKENGFTISLSFMFGNLTSKCNNYDDHDMMQDEIIDAAEYVVKQGLLHEEKESETEKIQKSKKGKVDQYKQNMDKMAKVIQSCLSKADIVQFGFIARDSGFHF